MKQSKAEIIREYGFFPDVARVNGVTFDGAQMWLAADDKLLGVDPDSGKAKRKASMSRRTPAPWSTASTCFRLPSSAYQKIDPKSGRSRRLDPGASGNGGELRTRLGREGSFRVGVYRERKIHQIDPQTGAILRTIPCSRYVTGVTWIDGELWHGTWEGEESDLRRVDPQSGETLETIEMPTNTGVSGLESNGVDRFFCGGGSSGKVRAVRRPKHK